MTHSSTLYYWAITNVSHTLQDISAVDATFNVEMGPGGSSQTSLASQQSVISNGVGGASAATKTRDEMVKDRLSSMLQALLVSTREYLKLPPPPPPVIATDDEVESSSSSEEEGSESESDFMSSSEDEEDQGKDFDEEEWLVDERDGIYDPRQSAPQQQKWKGPIVTDDDIDEEEEMMMAAYHQEQERLSLSVKKGPLEEQGVEEEDYFEYMAQLENEREREKAKEREKQWDKEITQKANMNSSYKPSVSFAPSMSSMPAPPISIPSCSSAVHAVTMTSLTPAKPKPPRPNRDSMGNMLSLTATMTPYVNSTAGIAMKYEPPVVEDIYDTGVPNSESVSTNVEHSATSKTVYVSDEDLCRLMEELENQGILQQVPPTSAAAPTATATAQSTASTSANAIASYISTTECSVAPSITTDGSIEMKSAPSHASSLFENCMEIYARYYTYIPLSGAHSDSVNTVVNYDDDEFLPPQPIEGPFSVTICNVTPSVPSRHFTELDREREVEKEKEIGREKVGDTMLGGGTAIVESDDISDEALLAMMDQWEEEQMMKVEREEEYDERDREYEREGVDEGLVDVTMMADDDETQLPTQCQPYHSSTPDDPIELLHSHPPSASMSHTKSHSDSLSMSVSFSLPPSTARRSSRKSLLPPSSVSSTGHHNTATKRRRLSPYVTPFTASKLRPVSPGRFLHLGLDSLRRHRLAVSLSLPGDKPCYPATEAIANSLSPGETPHGPAVALPSIAPGRYVTHAPFTVHDLTLAEMVVCQRFLSQMKTCRCISFELAFRPVPLTFMNPIVWYGVPGERKRVTPTMGGTVRDKEREREGLTSWTSLISLACARAFNVTSTQYDTVIHNFLDIQTPSAKELALSGSHVLTGIGLNFGDMRESYFLRLPLPPRLLPSTPPILTTTIRGRLCLDILPDKVKERIIMFVGFDGLLVKSLNLYSLLQRGNGNNIHIPMSKGEKVMKGNPLLLVSRHWASLSRMSLMIMWRSGACLEWKLLADIMTNPIGPVKVSSNIATKLVLLRERDVIVRGLCEDPAIANALVTVASTPAITSTTTKMCETHAQVPHSLLRTMFETNATLGEKEIHLTNARTIAGYRAALAMWYMSQYESQLQRLGKGQWELFTQIEMPLSSCSIPDLCHSGISIDASLLSKVRQSVRDRQVVIDYFLHGVMGTKWNVDSPQDVKKLKDLIKQRLTITLSSTNQSIPIGLIVKREDEREGKVSKSISDWSAGKEIVPHKPMITESESEGDNMLFTSQGSECERDCPILGLNTSTDTLDDVVSRHPLMRLVHEHRRHTRIIPMISAVLASRRFGRVRAAVNQLGAETGRLIVTNPPLQQVSYYVYTCIW